MPHDETERENSELSSTELRVKALESLLVEKGFVDPAALDAIIETYQHKVGPQNGALVVARAWSDPAFADWLKRDAAAAVASMHFEGRQYVHLVALFNTPTVHNMVVCTLCSCYPWVVLGLPPVWYKSAPYKSRVVMDPRSVLADFGFSLPESTEIRVWDSTSEFRYIVIPMRPPRTEGWTESQLATLVTRDSMIGTGLPKAPQ
jgi:nitrile hydratase